MRRWGFLLLAAAPLLAGCFDSGPSGPGAWTVEVSGPEALGPGAAVVLLRGEGITGFTAAGGSRVVGAPVAGESGAWRVLAVAPEGEPLRFRVEVQELRSGTPGGLALQAADRENRPLSGVEGVTVRVHR